jgi:hypothetical protein
VRGGRGAVATVADGSGRNGRCGSEVEEFEETGRRGGREGWSREAQQKVAMLAHAHTCCLMLTLRCLCIACHRQCENVTLACHMCGMCDSASLKRAQVNNLMDAAVVTLKSKFPGAILAIHDK